MNNTVVTRRPASVSILPWLILPKAYEIGDIRFTPVKEASLSTDELELVQQVAGRYWVARKVPISHSSNYTIAHKVGQSVTAELTEADMALFFVMRDALAFSGLSGREFFEITGYYCNTDNFILHIVQGQLSPEPDQGYTIRSRRRDGINEILTPPDHRDCCPLHVKHHEVKIDEDLLAALNCLRSKGDPDLWTRYVEVIVGYNLANTDRSDVGPQSEMMHHLGAMQYLMGTGHSAKDLRNAVKDIFKPVSHVPLSNPPGTRFAAGPPDITPQPVTSITDLWVRDFCYLRNDLAHGNVSATSSPNWSLHNHLLLASHFIPLLTKLCLQNIGCYTISLADQEAIDIFEERACEEHFTGLTHNGPYPWVLVQLNQLSKKMAKYIESRLTS
jgi:hypothetical protein